MLAVPYTMIDLCVVKKVMGPVLTVGFGWVFFFSCEENENRHRWGGGLGEVAQLKLLPREDWAVCGSSVSVNDFFFGSFFF